MVRPADTPPSQAHTPQHAAQASKTERGDVDQRFVVRVDFIEGIKDDTVDGSNANAGFLREMAKRELGLKENGNTATRKAPHPGCVDRISKTAGILFTSEKASEGVVLKGRAKRHG